MPALRGHFVSDADGRDVEPLQPQAVKGFEKIVWNKFSRDILQPLDNLTKNPPESFTDAEPGRFPILLFPAFR